MGEDETDLGGDGVFTASERRGRALRSHFYDFVPRLQPERRQQGTLERLDGGGYERRRGSSRPRSSERLEVSLG